MNLDELRERLRIVGVPDDHYHLGPGFAHGYGEVVVQIDALGRWQTFVSERGNIYDRKYHECESDACERALRLLIPKGRSGDS